MRCVVDINFVTDVSFHFAKYVCFSKLSSCNRCHRDLSSDLGYASRNHRPSECFRWCSSVTVRAEASPTSVKI